VESIDFTGVSGKSFNIQDENAYFTITVLLLFFLVLVIYDLVDVEVLKNPATATV